METTKTDRLFEFAKHKGYSFTDLAAILHLKKQQVSNWKNSNQPVPEKHLLKIIELNPDLNPRWLLTGNGNMLDESFLTSEEMEDLKEKIRIETIKEYEEFQKRIDVAHKEVVEMKDKIIEEKERLIEMKDQLISMMQKNKR